MKVLLQQVPLVITPALNGCLTHLAFRLFQTQLACLDFDRLHTSARLRGSFEPLWCTFWGKTASKYGLHQGASYAHWLFPYPAPFP